MAVLDWLFDSPPYATSFWYLAPAVIYALVLVAGSLVYAFSRSLFPGHSLHSRLARRCSAWAAVVGVFGLLVVGSRLAGIPYLGMNALITLSGLVAIGSAAYLGFFMLRRYPAQLAAHEAEQARRRFIKPIRTGGATRRRSKKARR